jgi:SEC-C motif-containing protein
MSIKFGRNAPCPCGSGKKFKKCCLNKSPDDFFDAHMERAKAFHESGHALLEVLFYGDVSSIRRYQVRKSEPR